MGTALMAVPSCTDTWNEHYQPTDEYTATESIWELLEGREDLSKFREIVSKAKYYRDEFHPAFTLNGEDTVFYTFKDVFSANTPITVWAPVNSALTEEEWAKFNLMAENEGYNLQQQLIGSHVALFRKTMNKTSQEKIRLINSKIALLNYDESMFQKAQILEKDIPARNGLLHVIETGNEFHYNLYEYIKFSGEVTTFRDYLVARDTTYFFEGGSIEGLPDENGNPTYVDSAYIQDNMMFNHTSYNPTNIDANDAWMNNLKMFHAQINTEDSSFVMIVPTDLAWENITNELKPFYTYVEKYPRMDQVKKDKKKAIDLEGSRASYPNGKGYETVDSLQDVNINMDIIQPLVFNLNLQPKNGEQLWNVETFITNKGYRDCEYLLTTTGDTIRDVYEEKDGVKTLIWSKDWLFEDANGETYIRDHKEMSNGYAVITDKWNFPRNYWQRDIDVEASSWAYYEKGSSTTVEDKDANNTLTADWIDIYGRCSEQRYLFVSGRTTSATREVTFPLRGSKQGAAYALSAKYDVQVVVVPLWYNDSEEEANNSKIQKNKLKATLYYWDESMLSKSDYTYSKQKSKNVTFEFSGEKVDTITIFEDFEFPVSYKNLLNTYPVIKIESTVKSASDVNKGYARDFNIDRIILKNKDTK